MQMEIPLLLVLPYMESRSYEEWADVYPSINLSMVTLWFVYTGMWLHHICNKLRRMS